MFLILEVMFVVLSVALPVVQFARRSLRPCCHTNPVVSINIIQLSQLNQSPPSPSSEPELTEFLEKLGVDPKDFYSLPTESKARILMY
jgi:hypothetical protein